MTKRKENGFKIVSNFNRGGAEPKRTKSESHSEKTKKKISPKNKTRASFLPGNFHGL